MWPSEGWASFLYDWANVVLVVGLVLSVTSTIVLIWTGNIKETYLRKELAATGERAAHAEERAANVETGNVQLRIDLETATAKSKRRQVELEIEQRKTAEAQKAAAEAQLAVNRSVQAFANRTGFRVLKVDEFVGILKAKPKGTAEIWYKAGDTEVERFSVDLYRAFDALGWPVSRRALQENDALSGIDVGFIDGLFVFANGEEQVSDVFHALLQSLQFGGTASSSTAPELPAGKVVVAIGPRINM